METKHLEVTIEKATSADYDARFVMSATSPDRVKDTIDEAAYKPNLGKKIIALWQHDSDKPFGYWHNLRVEAGKLIGDLKAARTNLGEMIKILIADGVPLGASIGFRGKGEENKQGGIHFKQIELLECSVVSVPAHPLAYQIAKQFKFNIETNSDDQDGKSATDLATVKQRAAAALQSSLKTLQKDK
jgi:HK97 family phage prohead protease